MGQQKVVDGGIRLAGRRDHRDLVHGRQRVQAFLEPAAGTGVHHPGPLPAVEEEPRQRMRERGRDPRLAPEDPREVAPAGDGVSLARFGGRVGRKPKEGRGGGAHLLDRPRARGHFLDINAWRQILGHLGNPPLPAALPSLTRGKPRHVLAASENAFPDRKRGRHLPPTLDGEDEVQAGFGNGAMATLRLCRRKQPDRAAQ